MFPFIYKNQFLFLYTFNIKASKILTLVTIVFHSIGAVLCFPTRETHITRDVLGEHISKGTYITVTSHCVPLTHISSDVFPENHQHL